MLLLIAFAFLGGIVTILSPCILPILPIVLSGSIGGNHRKPLGIVTGFVLSFTFFTLFLATIVKLTGVPADLLRSISVAILIIFGISLLIPQIQILFEKLFSKLSGLFSSQQNPNTGFFGGILIGISLGLIWTPCVGPIIASVITLAATSQVNTAAFFITLAYSLGTAIPMLVIMYGGRGLFAKIPWLLPNSAKIQKGFGVLMILTALGIYFNIDRRFQAYILETFPQYGVGLTKFEDNAVVKEQLEKIQGRENNESALVGDVKLDDSANAIIAPEIIEGGQWFNSEPLKIQNLKGKVVLVDFWTYTCINCIRTLPYLKSWHEKYSDKGLVIIGVHTPEFEFEKSPNNVKQAISDFGIKYPVIQDNDYATWRAYNNRFWPAKYFVDKNGKIRSTHFGEGAYDESEKIIQDLLKEAGSEIGEEGINNPDYQINAQTPELYLGYQRIEYLASPERIQQDKDADYSLPKNLRENYFALNGVWNIGAERSMPKRGSVLELNFGAEQVFLVMRPIKSPGKVKVFLNGKVLDQGVSGADVKNGVVTVDTDRLYKLIKLNSPGEHILKLEFLDSNLEVYAFTFG
jgi:cytochrome c biogenesis protein CcdA/thiol-disulfide isomerase/thioredoxin